MSRPLSGMPSKRGASVLCTLSSMVVFQVSMKDLASFIGVGVAVGTLIFGLCQYRRGRILDKAKFAATLTEKFYSEESLKAAWKFVDWRSGNVTLPDHLINGHGKSLEFIHGPEQLHEAMNVRNRIRFSPYHIDLVEKFNTPENRTYVEIFDRLFSFIENIYGYYVSKTIDLSHISNILYIADRLGKLSYNGEKIFDYYLAIHKYWRVIYIIQIADIYYANNNSWFIRWRACRRTKCLVRELTRKAERLMAESAVAFENIKPEI